MKVARIGGVDILVSPSVMVLAAAAACSGYLTRALILTAVVFLHEAAHSIAASFLGYRLEEVRAFPLGGSVRIGGMSGLDPIGESLVALAGPAANISLAMCAVLLKDHGLVPHTHADFFIAINTVIFLFNLLPALPLDGGRVFRSMLSCRIGIVNAARAAHFLGNLIAGLLILLALCRGFWNPLEVSMVAAAVFLFFAGAEERKMAASLMISQAGSKEGLLRKRGLLRSKPWRQPIMPAGRVISRFVPGYYHIVFVVVKTERYWAG